MFGKRLNYLRRISNVTQEQLGNFLGYTKNAISRWENGNSEPDLNTINKIANYFDVSVDYLINDEEKDDIEKLKSTLKEVGLLNGNDDMTKEDFEKALEIIKIMKETKDTDK